VPNVCTVQWLLEGWNGSPGVNTYHFALGTVTDPGAAALIFQNKMKDVYTSFSIYACDGWKATPTGLIRISDVATGNIVASAAYPTAGLAVTNNAGPTDSKESRATQLVMSQKTNVVRGRRLLQGRTFYGPMASNALGTDGQVSTGVTNGVRSAMMTVVALSSVVWSVWGQPAPERPVGTLGTIIDVVGSTKPGVLRSRRD